MSSIWRMLDAGCRWPVDGKNWTLGSRDHCLGDWGIVNHRESMRVPMKTELSQLDNEISSCSMYFYLPAPLIVECLCLLLSSCKACHMNIKSIYPLCCYIMHPKHEINETEPLFFLAFFWPFFCGCRMMRSISSK